MEQIILDVERRLSAGKGDAKKLRKREQMPAVLYSRDVKSVSLAINVKQMRTLLKKYGGTQIYTLKSQDSVLDGKNIIVREIQTNPRTEDWLHADLYHISMDRAIEIDIPVNIIGIAAGIALGGILQVVHRRIEVSCLPDRIPQHIDIDVSSLVIGQSIHIEDIKLPEGVKPLYESNYAIVTVTLPQAEEEKKEVVAEGEVKEGEAPAEGAAAAGAAGAKPDATGAKPGATGAKPGATGGAKPGSDKAKGGKTKD